MSEPNVGRALLGINPSRTPPCPKGRAPTTMWDGSPSSTRRHPRIRVSPSVCAWPTRDRPDAARSRRVGEAAAL